jgi:hypothetical protein
MDGGWERRLRPTRLASPFRRGGGLFRHAIHAPRHVSPRRGLLGHAWTGVCVCNPSTRRPPVRACTLGLLVSPHVSSHPGPLPTDYSPPQPLAAQAAAACQALSSSEQSQIRNMLIYSCSGSLSPGSSSTSEWQGLGGRGCLALCSEQGVPGVTGHCAAGGGMHPTAVSCALLQHLNECAVFFFVNRQLLQRALQQQQAGRPQLPLVRERGPSPCLAQRECI